MGLTDIELLRRLVAFDSASRNSNLPITDFIADYLDRPGVRITRNPSPEGDKANLVVALGPNPDPDARDGLLLSGHTDVVPADEPDWCTDPFTLSEVDGAYAGRGTSDMKGFLALAVNRAAALDPQRLRRPLALLFTYDEELGTLGAKQFVETWRDWNVLPRDTIIGEPTGLAVARMHKGYLKLRIVVTGRAAHSGYPHLGASAIEPAGRIIVALAELREALQGERPAHSGYFPEVPYAALNIGRVAGGVAINIVPDRCEIDLGIRLLPDMPSREMVERVRAAVRGVVGAAPLTLTVLGDSPAMRLDESAALYRALCAEVGQRETRTVGFATDAGWLQTKGHRCVVFGPGSIEVAHRANERLPMAEFAHAGEILERVIRRVCLAN